MGELLKNVLDGAFRKSHVNLTRWFLTIVNQSAAKEVLGDVKLAEKISHFSGSFFVCCWFSLGYFIYFYIKDIFSETQMLKR